jgi:serine phosphatase RsbU (regulator of sigma subunit)
MHFTKVLVNILFLLLSSIVCAQNKETGIPFIVNYSPEEYDAETLNWGVNQDSRGIMYFANWGGVLEYDGVKWRTIVVPNVNCRSIDIDKRGIIFAGSKNDFGYLKPDVNGNLVYQSLLHLVPDKYRNFNDVWETHATADGVFFKTTKYIFFYNYENIEILEAQKSFSLSFLIGDEIYINQDSIGLFKLNKLKLEPVPQGDTFAYNRVYSVIKNPDNSLLISTRGIGIYLLKDGKLTRFQTEADDFLKNNNLYKGIGIPGIGYAFATLRGGVVIVDYQGKILQILNEETGLRNNTVYDLYYDEQERLWLALDNGISKVTIKSPVTVFNETANINSSIFDITRFNGRIYAAGSLGVFYLSPKKNNLERAVFIHVSQIRSNSFALLPLEKTLLVASSSGIYAIEGEKVTLINKDFAFNLLRSKKDPNRIFCGLRDGIGSLYYNGNTWITESRIEDIKDEIRSLYEDDSGNLWAGTRTNGIVRLNSFLKEQKEAKFYDESSGILKPGLLRLFPAKGGFYAGTMDGVYKFDQDNDKFIFEEKLKFLQSIKDVKDRFFIKEDISENLWIWNERSIGQAFKNGNEYNWKPFLKLPREIIRNVFTEGDSTVWIGTANSIFKYNIKEDDRELKDFKINIRKVSTINNDTLLMGGYRVFEFPRLKYEDNDIRFSYAASCFDNEKENLYQYFLEGYSQEWSSWSRETQKDFTNLWEGEYRFRVRSKNIYGHISDEEFYSFSILPPWYRTFYSYIGYFLIFFIFILGLIKANSKRLQNRYLYLEQLVQERTNEITQKNLELEKQKIEILEQKEELEVKGEALEEAFEIIEKKNLDLTSSIHYAQKIQAAMLPFDEIIAQALPQHFILYKPRDIVSGDFYWFANLSHNISKNETDGEKVIFAVADCTGHGVPGAFMSMIGDSLLNQIVYDQGIIDPEKILIQMHAGIRRALKQPETDSLDGMDIAICLIDKKKKQIEYAGARSPLLVILDGTSKFISADKSSLGGVQSEANLYFKRQVITYSETLTLYMYSDGFQDQFGGKKGKKFMTKKFKELLLRIHEMPVEKQRIVLTETLDNWMKGHDQIDDILVVGIKL